MRQLHSLAFDILIDLLLQAIVLFLLLINFSVYNTQCIIEAFGAASSISLSRSSGDLSCCIA